MKFVLQILPIVSIMFWKEVVTDISTDTDGANVEKLSAIESQIDRLKSQVSDQDVTIARQNTKIAEQDTTIANLRVDVAGQDTKIAQQDTTIANLRVDVAGQDTKIAQQDTTIANLRADVAGQDTKIAQQDTTIANLRADIAGQNTKITEQDTTIANLPANTGGQNTKIAQEDMTIAKLQADIAEQNMKLAKQEIGVGLPQDWVTVLQNLNETLIVQANELTELGMLLRNKTCSADDKDNKLSRVELDKCIDETKYLNATLQELKSKEKEKIYNIAAGKVPTQSSTYRRYSSDLAVDNNWNGNVSHGSCSYTHYNLNPWWKLDLAVTHKVHMVIIKNRKDCCWNTLLNVDILVGEDPQYEVCGTFDAPTYAGEVRIIFCSELLQGRYVKIQLNGTNSLVLCEVAVYGYPLCA